MSPRKILSIVMQEIYLSRRSLEVIIDLGFFSIISTIVFGFVAVWLAGTGNKQSALYILVGLNFWNIVSISSYSIAVGTLWNIWSRSLTSVFVAPVSMKEYMAAHVLSALLKTAVIVVITSMIIVFVFKFNIFSLGLINWMLIFFNLFLFACSVGFTTLGLILRYGTRIQALAWSVSSLFQPLTAALYPINVLPPPLQTVAYALPPTYVFEATRVYINSSIIRFDLYLTSFVLNIVYLTLSLSFFWFLFNKSKETGQFAKNEE